MFDGSRKPLQQNIDETAEVVEMAHAAGISCEGEVGFVGYAGGASSNGTDPAEAAKFSRDSGIDALAISVGNVHLQQKKDSGLDLDRIAEIEAMTSVPLVIHGGSGVPNAQRTLLASQTSICKFNIGTELRVAFGIALRQAVASDPTRFDRVQILVDTIDPIQLAAQRVLSAFGAPPQR
jgi:fructose-bisphosphate aldolase class II